MMKKEKMNMLMVIVLTVMISFSMILFSSDVYAKMEVAPIKGASFNTNASLAQNLKTFTGKNVNITLNSGKTFTGIVKDVGNNLVHLEKLDGKEYYDALIRVEEIQAIDTRFRQPK